MVPLIKVSRPGPDNAKHPQTATLPPPYFTVGLIFFHFPKSSTEYLPKVLAIIKMFNLFHIQLSRFPEFFFPLINNNNNNFMSSL